MAKITKEMKQRLKDQGWKFSYISYWEFSNSNFQSFDNIYSNDKYPGVYILQRTNNHFEIFSDNISKTGEKRNYDIYDSEIKYLRREIERKEFMRLYEIGYARGYKNGYKIAEMEYSLNFFPKTRRKIKQFLQSKIKQK